MQLKSVDAPAARLATLAGVQAVQPVPVMLTFVIGVLPVLVSVTVIVTGVPTATVVPGLTDFVVRVVEAVKEQSIDPESWTSRPPFAVARADGFGCNWQAEAGVVAVLLTVTVTEAPAAIVPSAQLRLFDVSVHVPWLVVAVSHTRPPALGSVSVNITFDAGLAPAGAGLLTTILKLTIAPTANVPPSGVLTIDNCGGTHVHEPESVALKPPSAVAVATGFGCA